MLYMVAAAACLLPGHPLLPAPGHLLGEREATWLLAPASYGRERDGGERRRRK